VSVLKLRVELGLGCHGQLAYPCPPWGRLRDVKSGGGGQLKYEWTICESLRRHRPTLPAGVFPGRFGNGPPWSGKDRPPTIEIGIV
jgi:hypothetical protein